MQIICAVEQREQNTGSLYFLPFFCNRLMTIKIKHKPGVHRKKFVMHTKLKWCKRQRSSKKSRQLLYFHHVLLVYINCMSYCGVDVCDNRLLIVRESYGKISGETPKILH